MKTSSLKKSTFPKKIAQRKALLFVLLAVSSFLVMLFFCIRMKRDGVAFLVCLILHTCSLLLLYRDALIAIDPEDWETEAEWMQEDLPPEEFIPEERPAEVAVTYTKAIYTEVRQSLIETPAAAFAKTESSDALADALAASSPKTETAEPTEPSAEASSETAEDATETPIGQPAEEPPATAEVRALFAAPKQLVEMDLIAAAKDAIKSLTPFADAQKIKLHLSASCETLLMQADPESIRTLFRNIIDNSIKYMGQPGHMMITISLLGDDIFLILKDTGNGLAAEETRHVFELNFQGSNRVSGNGLGLTQTKMIVEAFGGTIYAKSNPGNGMAIYIQLPVSGQSNRTSS